MLRLASAAVLKISETVASTGVTVVFAVFANAQHAMAKSEAHVLPVALTVAPTRDRASIGSETSRLN